MLGIGASSSAAYTLRKHYTKNLFPFECHFDRGGVDPLPIIQQIESGSKKKAPKQVSAPSPDANHKGSSNSQDSFQGLYHRTYTVFSTKIITDLFVRYFLQQLKYNRHQAPVQPRWIAILRIQIRRRVFRHRQTTQRQPTPPLHQKVSAKNTFQPQQQYDV